MNELAQSNMAAMPEVKIKVSVWLSYTDWVEWNKEIQSIKTNFKSAELRRQKEQIEKEWEATRPKEV